MSTLRLLMGAIVPSATEHVGGDQFGLRSAPFARNPNLVVDDAPAPSGAQRAIREETGGEPLGELAKTTLSRGVEVGSHVGLYERRVMGVDRCGDGDAESVAILDSLAERALGARRGDDQCV